MPLLYIFSNKTLMYYLNLQKQDKLPNHYLYYVEEIRETNSIIHFDLLNRITKQYEFETTVIHTIQDENYMCYTSFQIHLNKP